MKRALFLFLLAVCAGPAGATERTDHSVTLDTAVSHPVLLCDKTQTVYIRVALRGHEPAGACERPPVNVAIVLDKSGSMQGEKIVRAKDAAAKAVCRLGPEDIVSVVTYDTNVRVVVPATKAHEKEWILSRIEEIHAGGSTALHAGVEKGAAELRKFHDDRRVSRLVLLSDGLANVGPSSPAELARLGQRLGGESIAVTTIGLGMGYNEDLMTQLAYGSDGSHYFAENARDLARIFDEEFGRALSVVAQEVEIEVRCGPGVRPLRWLGRTGTIGERTARSSISHIYSQHERYVLLELEVPAGSTGRIPWLAEVDVRYDNLLTHERQRFGAVVTAQYTLSSEQVAKAINAEVMAAVVEQIATERNEQAVKLRDQGQVQEARSMLEANAQYLYEHADRYHSDRLAEYGGANVEDARNLAPGQWAGRRKAMREAQSINRGQR